MKRTTTQNKRLYQLLNRLGINKDSQEDMVYSFTNGRTTKSSEMTYIECNSMIKELEFQAEGMQKREGKFKQQLRRNIFKLMYDTGLINNSMDSEGKMEMINAWAKNKLHFTKELNYLSIDELNRFVRQLQAVRRNYVEQAEKAAMWN